ncbi:MAG TPA: transposase [Bacillota bacterium]|nr:transposase [Bacillota bacterium]
MRRREVANSSAGTHRAHAAAASGAASAAEPRLPAPWHSHAFAALDTATGKVVTEFHQRHRHQEVLAFLRQLNREYPRQDLHIVWDNYCTHQHAAVGAWLGKHPRFHVHYTPTSASWMNQVETFFSILTTRAGVLNLMATIRRFIAGYQEAAQPFVWTKTATHILAKARPAQC